MTPRLTVAVTLLTLGLAVAALAGIPALVENRAIGDVVVECGLALAVAGIVLGVTAIPGARRSRAETKRNHQADIDDLIVKRQRIIAQRRSAQQRLDSLSSAILMRGALRASGDVSNEVAERRVLEVELINHDADLATNANDLKRLGYTVLPTRAASAS